jgi:hypothetical protein
MVLATRTSALNTSLAVIRPKPRPDSPTASEISVTMLKSGRPHEAPTPVSKKTARVALAAELVRRQVAVIVAAPVPAAVAAKAATATVPIVFNAAGDPVKLGLVAGLARPGGNATGVHSFQAELGAKQLGLLRELLPTAARIGLLVNPINPIIENVESVTKDVTEAASAIGVEIDIVRASDSREIEVAFVTLVRNRADALVVSADSFFYNRRLQLATLATRHAMAQTFRYTAGCCSRTFAIAAAPWFLKSAASARRKSLLNDLRVASKDPPGFPYANGGRSRSSAHKHLEAVVFELFCSGSPLWLCSSVWPSSISSASARASSRCRISWPRFSA